MARYPIDELRDNIDEFRLRRAKQPGRSPCTSVADAGTIKRKYAEGVHAIPRPVRGHPQDFKRRILDTQTLLYQQLLRAYRARQRKFNLEGPLPFSDCQSCDARILRSRSVLSCFLWWFSCVLTFFVLSDFVCTFVCVCVFVRHIYSSLALRNACTVVLHPSLGTALRTNGPVPADSRQ